MARGWLGRARHQGVDQIWLVAFLDYDLGFFDMDEGRVEPAPNPFAPEKVLTMSPAGRNKV